MIILPDPAMDIALIAIVFGLISFAINRKLIDQKAMKASQKEMSEKRKKMMELLKKEDKQSKKESDKLNQEIMNSTTKMMKGSLKAMGVMLIIFLPIYWFISSIYNEAEILLPIALPILGTKTSWFWWWVIVGIITSILLQIGIKLIEKIKK